MNGYYGRKSDLNLEEIRPLDFSEIAFVTDFGERSNSDEHFSESEAYDLASREE